MSEVIAQIVPLKDVTYKTFKEFLDSLDEERKSWSLDLQYHKNDKEFYDSDTYAIVCVINEKLVGFCSCYENSINPELIEISFVVKKDYQGQGIGSTLLKVTEGTDDTNLQRDSKYKYIIAKHYKDNIASHKAFLKAGYKEWKKVDDDWEWKIKEIK